MNSKRILRLLGLILTLILFSVVTIVLSFRQLIPDTIPDEFLLLRIVPRVIITYFSILLLIVYSVRWSIQGPFALRTYVYMSGLTSVLLSVMTGISYWRVLTKPYPAAIMLRDIGETCLFCTINACMYTYIWFCIAERMSEIYRGLKTN